MGKLKSIFTGILGALSVFFYVLLKSKEHKIESQAHEIEAQKQKIKEKEFINDENDKTIVIKNDLSHISDDDIERMYAERGWIEKR